MKYQEVQYKGKIYKWGAYQDSEHPDFVLQCELGEIWVQVEVNPFDKKHNEMYLNGKNEFPISNNTAHKVISNIVKLGYTKSYFESDVGLIFTDSGRLIEN